MPPSPSPSWLISSQDEISSAAEAELGGKARGLARMQGVSGASVPEWAAILPGAFWASLFGEEGRKKETERSGGASLPEEMAGVHLAPPLELALMDGLARIFPDRPLLALRSSAAEEDGTAHSFAGQLESFLDVAWEDVPERVAEVWRSGFSERALAYRRERGLAGMPPPPSVLVQRMVRASVSGVAFGADPVSGRRGVAVVSALWGLGTALVGGESDADVWHVGPDGAILARRVADKRRMRGPGDAWVEVAPERVSAPCLSDKQIQAVATLARAAGRQFGRPQDIEWAIDNAADRARLWLLQSRPVTSLRDLPDPDGDLGLWDNSNIAESYAGVTTPLTFSFARNAYEEVYRQFCRLMGVPERRIAAHRPTFARMLGLVRGRVYYNLLSWYRVLALLPGYATNRRFMEQMMGVREPLPEEIALRIGAETEGRGGLRDRWELLASLLGLVRAYFSLPRLTRKFFARLENSLGDGDLADEKLAGMRGEELAAHFRELERKLLARWDAPLVNDFFAMIFYGLLGKLSEKWCEDKAGGSLRNDLIAGEGGMISAEPARRVRDLAEITRQAGPEFVNLLVSGTRKSIEAEIIRRPEFAQAHAAYLRQFGDRCLEELKLESATLHDDPLPLFRSVGHFARQPAPKETESPVAGMRKAAEGQVARALQGHWLRRQMFNFVLRATRRLVVMRENLRFERTRVFGRVRRIFLETGRRLTAADLLEDERDVFWLTVEEALGLAEGTATLCSREGVRGLVALRRAEFIRWRGMEAPGDRFETRGSVHPANSFRASKKAKSDTLAGVDTGDILHGVGCCPGVVRGRARVVLEPRGAVVEPGEILVAPRTDPGWILLFPSAAGLAVEYGSLLSHSAIVSRELGLPGVVSISGLTARVKTGDWLELDGAAGTVRCLKNGPEQNTDA